MDKSHNPTKMIHVKTVFAVTEEMQVDPVFPGNKIHTSIHKTPELWEVLFKSHGERMSLNQHLKEKSHYSLTAGFLVVTRGSYTHTPTHKHFHTLPQTGARNWLNVNLCMSEWVKKLLSNVYTVYFSVYMLLVISELWRSCIFPGVPVCVWYVCVCMWFMTLRIFQIRSSLDH